MPHRHSIPRFLLRSRRPPAYAYASAPASHAPVGYQFGYVFESGPEDRLIKTASHELGHGRFQLRHTFVPPLEIADTTDNLMSYHPTGTTLCKRQWDYLHDPQWRVFRFLQGEEEGRLAAAWIKTEKFTTTFIPADLDREFYWRFVIDAKLPDWANKGTSYDFSYKILDNKRSVVYNQKCPIKMESGRSVALGWDGRYLKNDVWESVIPGQEPFAFILYPPAVAWTPEVPLFSRTFTFDNNWLQWQGFRFKDKPLTFDQMEKRIANDTYADALPEEYKEAPIKYMQKHLVTGWSFMGSGLCSDPLNIYMYYALKKAEASLAKADYDMYKGTISVGGARLSGIPGKSNHALGFAVDMNVGSNPNIRIRDDYKCSNTHGLYYLIWLLTNFDLLGYGSSGGDTEIKKMKECHNCFISVIKQLPQDREAGCIERLKLWPSIDEYENNAVHYTIEGWVTGAIESDIQVNTGIPQKMNETILKIENLREFYFNVIQGAFYLDVTCSDEITSMRKYFDDIVLFAQNHSNNPSNSAILPVLPEKIKTKLVTAKQKLTLPDYADFSTFSAMSENIQTSLQGNNVCGGGILNYGFFELPYNVVSAILKTGWVSWGGFYPRQHDWMHFEIRDDKAQYGATHGSVSEEEENYNRQIDFQSKITLDYILPRIRRLKSWI